MNRGFFYCQARDFSAHFLSPPYTAVGPFRFAWKNRLKNQNITVIVSTSCRGLWRVVIIIIIIFYNLARATLISVSPKFIGQVWNNSFEYCYRTSSTFYETSISPGTGNFQYEFRKFAQNEIHRNRTKFTKKKKM